LEMSANSSNEGVMLTAYGCSNCNLASTSSQPGDQLFSGTTK